MRNIINCFLVALFSLYTMQSLAQQRKRINFDDNWKFAFGSANDPVKDFNYSIATIFSKTGCCNDNCH